MAVTVVAQKAVLAKATTQKAVVPKAATKVQKVAMQEKVMAGVTVAAAAALTAPIPAEAAVTPSLRNLLYSVVAGGTVLVAIVGAIVTVSQFDPVNRK